MESREGWSQHATFQLEVLQADRPSATLKSLQGSAIVIDFWATWCPGCVAALPHFNELAERFKGQSVRFIAATDEDKTVVLPFLKRRPISAWVGIDARGETFSRFGIDGRPQVALIDANGVLRGILQPSEVTADTVERLVAGHYPAYSRDTCGRTGHPPTSAASS